MSDLVKVLAKNGVQATIIGADPINDEQYVVSVFGDNLPEWQTVQAWIDNYTPEKRRVGTFREFMDLFTEDEVPIIATAILSVPVLFVWQMKASGSSSFSLDHQQTEIGLQALVDAGILTPDRKATILDSDFNA
tara:strand:- start:509 stop:910 length:402 start_codon:yes stop_codon:yes gene_type:complete